LRPPKGEKCSSSHTRAARNKPGATNAIGAPHIVNTSTVAGIRFFADTPDIIYREIHKEKKYGSASHKKALKK
jgi:hypothetical protein